MEEIIFLIRDSEENLLVYLNADGSLKAEVKPGAASILPESPITHVYGTPERVVEISENHPLYLDALLSTLYDQGFYNDEMFIEVDDKDAIDNIFNSKPESMFAEEDPNLRSGGGSFEDSTNRTQRRLVNIYDAWAVETRNLIMDAQDRGIGQQGFTAIVNGRLSKLETSLVDVQQEGINAAVALAVSATLLSRPSVRNVVLAMTATAAQGLRIGLIDSIRDRLTSKLQDTADFDRSGLKGIFDTVRASVASSAGVAWNGLFVALFAAGREQEKQSGRTQRVRWLLNDLSEHCAASPGKFACPEMAGTYNSWAELPTVPAGDVTCRGNCRCVLEAETEPGSNVWERGLPEFTP